MLPDTLVQAKQQLDRGELSAVDLTEALFARIDAVEPAVGAFIHVNREGALDQARAADARRAAGEDAPLLGLPLALKDLICVKDERTTCASRILENFTAPYDATVARRLKEAGAVLIGKTNMDEFAMGSSNENSAFHPTRNPWDRGRVAGGSSGGSAAAVAAGECLAALGSDTGGSIRQPAAFCGITGLKPTYGRVSRFGLVAFASSLDQIGPVTRTVEDAALLLRVIAGADGRDSTCAEVPVPDYPAELERKGEALRVGVPREFFAAGLDPAVERAVEEALRTLESQGLSRVDVSLPHTAYAVAAYYILACAEASTNLARYDGVKYGYRSPDSETLMDLYTNTREEGFGEEVKRRILLGTFVLSSGYYDAYYLKGQKVRTLIRRDFDRAFEQCDVIAGPVSPVPAFKLGEKRDDPLQMYLSDVYTISTNLAGLPGLSIPCGFSEEGLPIGLQLIGRPFDEATLLRVGHGFQKETGHHTRRPDL